MKKETLIVGQNGWDFYLFCVVMYYVMIIYLIYLFLQISKAGRCTVLYEENLL